MSCFAGIFNLNVLTLGLFGLVNGDFMFDDFKPLSENKKDEKDLLNETTGGPLRSLI
jgi:hypothetical protein